MFELEFDIKMKAQLKYMEKKQASKRRDGFFSTLQHEYLWTPTTTYYLAALGLFMFIRKKYQLQLFNVIPFMMLPVTADYLKREYYVSKVEEKDRKELQERRQVIQRIINEKRQFVTFEHVMRYLFRLNLDKPISREQQKQFLPLTF